MIIWALEVEQANKLEINDGIGRAEMPPCGTTSLGWPRLNLNSTPSSYIYELRLFLLSGLLSNTKV